MEEWNLKKGSIRKIRDIVKNVKSSPQRLDVFKKCGEESNVKYTTSLQLDCPTRWNSTYLMLNTTVGYEKAFDKFEDLDGKVVIDFGEDLPCPDDRSKAGV
ncbi:hypothetical protein GH714_035674 [Hevea brasiliensis]|uniref:hAT-like transposase RNase-H fold domain-containing protein n=1 Tax=Hevea brasiliensis TaxID=3981 RepID=A0A6A6LVU3_HEVBR|nr:hypothetical protein GH714_035674 [Hevea brasiliensis]